MVVDQTSRDVVVARHDAIYYYGQHGRGPPFTFDGEKKLISTFKDYIVIVAPPKPNTMTRSDPLRAFGVASADDAFNTSSFTLLNTELRFVAHHEQLTSQVKAVVSEWGDLFVFTIDGKVYKYHEKPFAQKLEILYQRNLYVLAINLAQKAGLDSSQQNIILRKFGDYLYSKQDYDTAMQQYLKAIDNTEPSQVIRKFLDTQRIHNLIEYLEELHDHHKATADHTTLLLNCYAKLKDVEKLEEFIKSPDDLKFDLDTAISMCRQGGYYDQAAFLARKHGEHELVVDVLIEDSKRFAEALAYIWRLEPEVAYYNLMKYATVLLQQIPKDTTKLFIDYYTATFRPKKDIIIIPDAPSSGGGSGIGMGLGVASSAVQNLAALLPLPYMNSNALASPPNGDQKSTMSQAQIIEMSTDEPVPQYRVPKPRTAFSAFVDHPHEFIVFLEACIKSENLREDDKVDLYTTLFEMYLHTASSKKNAERQEWENKAKNLVQGKDIPIDTSNVLLLSHLSDFRDGAILVREQQGLHFDIFRSFTAARDTQGAIRALRKYGPEEPALYPAALAYFTSSPEILSEASDELDTVLKRIDEDGLMAPLQVIQTLSSNGVATMGMIKSYLSATIERERAEIASNRRTIETFRSDTETKKQELANLNTKPVVFQTSRCQICSKPLELPVVHFLCKHSFHQSCLSTDEDVHDSEVECPICSANNATVKAIRRAQVESAERHDLFQDALKRGKDGFAVISEWFGRGVMGVGGAE